MLLVSLKLREINSITELGVTFSLINQGARTQKLANLTQECSDR